MANWCECSVTLHGSVDAVATAVADLGLLAAAGESSGEGQVPEGAEADGAMFSISTFEDGVQYETKGGPNHDAMRVLADRHGIGFVLTFHEPNDQRYGEVTYGDGELTGIELNGDAFEAYEHDDDDDTWSFEGGIYESELDVLALLLDRRRASNG